MRLEIGQIYGDKYRILRRIGEGAMGAVYEGENVRIHRRVAIKTLHGGVASKADVITRFEREAQAAGRIGSEHIVEVLDMGELEDGTRFMVMEFLEGVTLAKRIRSKGRLSPDEACTFLIELLDGLAGAQTHRSWWVARSAVIEGSWSSRGATLALKGGVVAPVSRTYAKALKDQGWFA